MMKRDSGNALLGLLIMGIVGFVVGGFLWTYTINAWLSYAGKETSIVFWQGGLIGFVPYLGHLSIPAAVITWLLLLFLI